MRISTKIPQMAKRSLTIGFLPAFINLIIRWAKLGQLVLFDEVAV